MAIYLPGKSPTPDINAKGYVTHDYGAGKADWVLRSAEADCMLLSVTNAAGGAVNIVAPLKVGKMFVVKNGSGQSTKIKVPGGSGLYIANARVATVICGESDYYRVTADATF